MILQRGLNQLRKLYQCFHHDLTLILLVATVARLLAIVALRPGGYIAETGPDSAYHFQLGRLAASGAYPFIDYWVEYPPVFPWLSVLAYKIATLLPSWLDQRFWFNLALHSLILPFDTANIVLVYTLARRVNDSAALALKSAWLYALLFTPAYVVMGWFESIALFAVLLALWAILTNRFWLAGLAVGLGVLTKPYAIIISAVAVARLPGWRSLGSFVSGVVLVLALGLGPFLLTSPEMVIAHGQTLLTLPGWSTPYALIDGAIKHTDPPLVDRFDPALATKPLLPSRIPWAVITPLFAVGYGLIWLRATRFQHTRSAVGLAGVTFIAYLLWSKGYSPQWMLYLMAFICILMPNLRGAIILITLDMLYVLEWPVTFILLRADAGYLAALVIIRTLILIGLAFLFWGLLSAQRPLHWQRLRLASLAGSLLAVPAVVGLAISALPLYAVQRYQSEPLREAAELIRLNATPQEAAVLFDRVDTYERLAPYLDGFPQQAALQIGGPADTWSEGELGRFAAERPQLWYVLDYGAVNYRATAESINRRLSETLCPISQQFAGNALLARYANVAVHHDLGATAVFADGIRLDGAASSQLSVRPDEAVCIELTWLAVAMPSADYTVFVHLLDGNGQLVAQSDLTPGNGYAPTSRWTPGEAVVDRHGLILPAGVAPGRYDVMVGLYEAMTGVRVPLVSAEGDAFLLTQIDVQP